MNKRPLFADKVRLLTQTLILSVVLNIAFLVVFFYFFIKENPFPLQFTYLPTPAPKEELLTNKEAFHLLETLSFEKLSPLLKDNRLVEEGIRVRDLALGLLIINHHFDLERALGRVLPPSRILTVEPNLTYPLYTALKEEDFCTLFYFASVEKWPFTVEHLFTVVKEQGENADPAQLQMFFQTQEFLLAERLFKGSPIPMQRKLLLSLLREGKYANLKRFAQEQKTHFDLSEKQRRDFLLSYVKDGSPSAALLLVYTDTSYAAQYLDDETLLLLLSLLPKNNQKVILFAGKLIHSLRGDKVLAKAREILASDKDLSQFKPTPNLAELRTAPKARPPASPPVTQKPASQKPMTQKPMVQEHVIQAGESLWSIAKKYQLSVDELMRLNHLTTTSLQPGKVLKLK